MKVDALKVPPSLIVDDGLKVLTSCPEDYYIVPVYNDETVKVLSLIVDALKVLPWIVEGSNDNFDGTNLYEVLSICELNCI